MPIAMPIGIAVTQASEEGAEDARNMLQPKCSAQRLAACSSPRSALDEGVPNTASGDGRNSGLTQPQVRRRATTEASRATTVTMLIVGARPSPGTDVAVFSGARLAAGARRVPRTARRLRRWRASAWRGHRVRPRGRLALWMSAEHLFAHADELGLATSPRARRRRRGTGARSQARSVRRCGPARGDITIRRVARNSASSTPWVMKNTILLSAAHSFEDHLLDRSRASARRARPAARPSAAPRGRWPARARCRRAAACRPRARRHGAVDVLLEADQRAACRATRPCARAWPRRACAGRTRRCPHVEPGQQRVLLEHHAAVGAGPDDRAAVEQDLALGGVRKPAMHVQQRGLAAARGAERDDEVARRASAG